MPWRHIFSKVGSLDQFEEEFICNMVEAKLEEIDFTSPDKEDYNEKISLKSQVSSEECI